MISQLDALDEIANQVVDSCPSTNDLARRLAEAGYPHGTWVSTRDQVAGRGRLGRQWKSMEGNLFLSIIVRVDERRLWTWVPLAAAVGVVRAVRDACPGVPVQIKWPNDLWVGDAKLGGILCESVGTGSGTFIVIGIGMNCVAAPEGVGQATVHLTECCRGPGEPPVTADEIRKSVVDFVIEAVDLLSCGGLPVLRNEYEHYSRLKPGVVIYWKAGDRELQGTVTGLGESGELLVQTDDGRDIRLLAEDVSVRPGDRGQPND